MLRFASTIILCGVLCSTFIDYGANDCFFLLFPFAVSVGIAGLWAFALSVMKENRFRFTLPDGLITGGVIYYLVRYDYQLHLADWKVIYMALLLLLWYIVRILFSSPQVSKKMLSVGIVGIGCLLAGSIRPDALHYSCCYEPFGMGGDSCQSAVGIGDA